MRGHLLLRLLVRLLLLGYLWIPAAWGCPRPCTCTQMDKDSDNPGKRVQCDSVNPQVTNLTLITGDLPERTKRLDLSGNAITIIPRGAFSQQPDLQQLDLSNNQIRIIEPGAFYGLHSLQKLNLSGNKIATINSSTFEDLPSLKKLYISGNQLQTVPNGTFDPLIKLERVDFQSELLLCDCRLQWIVHWMKSSKARVRATECSLPEDLKGTLVHKLREEDLHCQWDLLLPVFELHPSQSQIVFEGDKLPFQCRASRIESDTRIHWLRKEMPVTNKTQGVLLTTQQSPDGTLVSSLVLESLKIEDKGIWKCMVETPRGNETKGVNIVVISDNTPYCPAVTTSTNKGTYFWPKSVAGVRSEMPCKTGKSSKFTGKGPPRALHECNEKGHWQNLDTDQCQYESEVTIELEQFAESGNVSWMQDKGKHLTQYMHKIQKSIQDKMDVIFLSRIIERISHNVPGNKHLGDVILQLVSNLMDVDANLLKQAQKEDKACTRMIRVVERLPQQMLHESLKILSQHSGNIALEAMEINEDNFPGLMCIAMLPQPPLEDFKEDTFVCSSVGNTSMTNMNLQDDWLAIIYTPASMLQRAPCESNSTCPSGDTYQIQYIVYKDARLFPVFARPEDEMAGSISTPVISAAIVDTEMSNLTSPIMISLRNKKDGINRRPVFWDFDAQGGYGQWKTDGCWVAKETEEFLTFQCNHLTNFGILQSDPVIRSISQHWYWLLLGLEPPIYAGSCVLLFCALAVIITYAAAPGELKMSSKAKHSIGNLAAGLFLLCLVFTFGIKMTRVQLACQIVGIVIHYLSICVLFWILITAYNMYRSFTRLDRPHAQPLDSIESPIPPKPMLRFYLIGWGIALIVVGITAAVNLHHYAGEKSYCFLSFEPSIGAFLVPVAILTTLNLIFFMRICCVLKGSSPLPLDEPETEEINELEITNNEIESIPQDNVSTSSSEDSTMDLEYKPASQLRALVTVLFLYLITWTCAAFVIAGPLEKYIPYHGLIFNYAYAFFAAFLGIFLYCFYCIARRDARLAWKKACCCHQTKPMYAMNPNMSAMHRMNGQMLQSTSSMNSEYTSKSSNTNYSNPLRYYSTKKPSNINMVQSQSMTDPSVISSGTEAMPSFYNPRQNGAAKKYWGRKNHIKNLNLLHKERNSDVSFSAGEGRSSRERMHKQNNRLSYNGNSSDANTHLSIEIQIQSAQVHATRNSKPNSLPRGLTHVNKLDGPYTIEASQPLLPMSDFNLTTSTPLGHYKQGLPGGSFTGGYDNYSAGNHINVSKDAVPLVSLSPVGYGISPLVPAEVTCTPPPKNLNIDSFSGVSSVPPNLGEKRMSLNTELQNMEMYRPPDPPVVTRRPLSGESDGLSGHRSHDSKEGEAKSHHSSDSGTGSRKRKKRESFMDQLEQRIPHNKSPGLARSNPSSREPTLTRGVRSPNPSDAWSQDSDLTSGQDHAGQPGSTTQSGEESHVTSNQSSDDTHPRDSSNRLKKPPTGNHVKEKSVSPNPSRSNTHSDNDNRSEVTMTLEEAVTQSDLAADLERKERKKSRGSKKKTPINAASPPQAQDSASQGNKSDHSSGANTSQDGRSSRGSRLSNKSPKNWEDEFKNRPPRAAYSFVNHQYHDKVLHKLIQQSANGLIDPIARGLAWFPRSISAYEQVANDIVENHFDSSDDSSSDDHSVDDIWVLQKRKSKDKFKKETSV